MNVSPESDSDIRYQVTKVMKMHPIKRRFINLLPVGRPKLTFESQRMFGLQSWPTEYVATLRIGRFRFTFSYSYWSNAR